MGRGGTKGRETPGWPSVFWLERGGHGGGIYEAGETGRGGGSGLTRQGYGGPNSEESLEQGCPWRVGQDGKGAEGEEGFRWLGGQELPAEARGRRCGQWFRTHGVQDGQSAQPALERSGE